MSDNAPSSTKQTGKYVFIWSVIISSVALAAVITVAIFSWNNWKKSIALLQQNTSQVTQLQDNLNQLQHQLVAQQRNFSRQQMNMKAVLHSAASDNKNWQLAEAEYLIRLANFSVNFESNVPVATQLLNAAENRIASLNNPTLLPIRQILTNNIAELNAVPKVDTPSILLQLNALGAQIDKLPVIATPNEVPQEQAPSRHHHQPGWKRGLAQSWQQLKQIIVVQYHNKPVGQLITPEKRHYLDLHLQMLIEQAQWACLHQQNTLYTQSLQQAIDWTKNYYVGSAAQTQAMLMSLQQLVTINIAPVLPNISGSLAPLAEQLTSSNGATL